MTDKELVERLNAYSSQYQNHGGITAEAADRIEQLHTELTKERIDNTNLIGELATVAAERDRYKAERENPQPLTLEELRRMDGEPIWGESLISGKPGEWSVLRVVEMSKIWFIAFAGATQGFGDKDSYGKTWLAYRSKPKGCE